MEVYFATSNSYKFEEAQKILPNIKRFIFKHIEIRSEKPEEIALEAVNSAYRLLKKPVFVEDTGLFIESLNGFPGTYSGWTSKKIGNSGIIRLLKGIKQREAYFKTSIAFRDKDVTKNFRGLCKGIICSEERGFGGFGYDSIFIPSGYSKTFAEDLTAKKQISHRTKAIIKLRNFLAANKLRKD